MWLVYGWRLIVLVCFLFYVVLCLGVCLFVWATTLCFLWLYWLLLVSMVVVCCLVWCLFLVVWVRIDGVFKILLDAVYFVIRVFTFMLLWLLCLLASLVVLFLLRFGWVFVGCDLLVFWMFC